MFKRVLCCCCGLFFVLFCFACFALLFIRMFQDYVAVVKVFIYSVLFKLTSYFSTDDFTSLIPFSTTLLVKYECLLFATAVIPVMWRPPVIEKSYHAPVRQIRYFKIYSKIYLIGLTFPEIVLIHHYSTWSIILNFIIYKTSINNRGKSLHSIFLKRFISKRFGRLC